MIDPDQFLREMNLQFLKPVRQVLVAWDGSPSGTRLIDPATGKELHLDATTIRLSAAPGDPWRCELETFADPFAILADLQQPVILGFYDRAGGGRELQSAMAIVCSPSPVLPDGTHPLLLTDRGAAIVEAVNGFAERLGLGQTFAQALIQCVALRLAGAH